MGENEASVVHYRPVADQSRFTVQAFSEGLLSAFGHDPIIAIRDFTGEVAFTPGTLSEAQLRMTIRADSLALSSDVSEKDRLEIERMMRKEVLETEKYPEIVFASTNVTASRLAEGRHRVRIIGDLTLHGITRNNIWIDAEVTLTGEGLRARGEFSLRQTAYEIKPTTVAGGTLKVKNELKLSFDISAQQKNKDEGSTTR